MKKDDFKTAVVFRKFKDTGDIIALFPYSYFYILGIGDTCESYMHVGQHSDANYSFVLAITKPAKESEYNALLRELESIGYNLQVIKKRIRK